MTKFHQHLILASALAALAGLAGPVLAQPAFPSKTITIIVPFPPGGVVDPVARIMAPKLSQELGHPVVIDNRAGAGGVIGAAAAGRAEPDGHTILLTTGSVSVHPNMLKNPGYDVRKDLVPVSLIASGPYTFAVNPALPVKTFSEFLTYARGNPGKVFYGSAGTGSSTHLIGELFNSMAGTRLVHVPYKGNGPMKKNPGYDTRRDLVPVSMIASGPYVLVVNNSLPVTSVREFLAYAKANPGKLFYGSSGTGSSLHLITELLNSESGLDIRHVPYKGNGPVMTALIGGEIQMAFDTIPGSKALGDAGRVRMLAVTSEGRNAALPNLPSLSEGGVKGFEAVLWEGFFLPKGTPDAIVTKWNAAIRAVLQDPEVKRRLTELGFDVAGSTPRELKDRVEADLAKWAAVTKHARISLE